MDAAVLAPVDEKQIHEFCARIARYFHPEKIILFGSHAYGTPTIGSDVDLLVIGDYEGRSTEAAIKILTDLDPAFAVDLLVRTPRQIRERVAAGDFFLRDVLANGRLLYDAAHH